MQSRKIAVPAGLGERRGFVMPVVIFGLVLMSAVAVAALMTAGDELTSSQAMRDGSMAFYAAEAGLNEVYAIWAGIDSSISLLDPGETKTLDWRDVASGGKYQATVVRWDTGGSSQPMFTLTVEGRGRGILAGRRLLSYSLTALPAEIGYGYNLGGCCRAAVTMRGTAEVEESAGVSGFDEDPADWGAACPDTVNNKPGIIIKDEGELDFDTGGYAEGAPAPVLEDPTLNDDDFDNFGGLTWEDLKDMADVVLGDHPSEQELHDFKGYGPTLTAEGECDTSNPKNFGSPDPAHPCFDYFPIVLVVNEVHVYDDLYMQGIFVLDWDESAPYGMKGTEFDLEEQSVFNGVLLGKGCIEIEDSANFHGAAFIDGYYRNEAVCMGDKDFAMNNGTATTKWSQCAVDRAIFNSGLGDWADVEEPAPPARPILIGSRAFGEGR